MKKNAIAVLIVLLAVMGMCGCIYKEKESDEIKEIINDCIALCEEARANMNLSHGPCLSDNNPKWKHEGWVCDVAHSPRLPVDNLPENQCREYREGKASHFVEVNEQCEYIRHY